MNAAETAAVRFGSAQPRKSSRGLKKIPPPTPMSPARKPRTAPSASPTGQSRRGSTSPAGAIVRPKPSSRSAARSSAAPSSSAKARGGIYNEPPRNAIGIDVTAKGKSSLGEKCPARL